MKRKRGVGRPLNNHHKIGLSVDKDVLKAAQLAAVQTSRTLSGFFENAAKNEIARINGEAARG